MAFYDLREFVETLKQKGLLRVIRSEVSPVLEISEIMDRLVKKGGPAVMFEKVKGYDMPVVANLYGTRYRVNLGLGTNEEELRNIGEFIAFLQRPKPPEGIWEALRNIPLFSSILTLTPKPLWSGPCQEVILAGDDASLSNLPIIKCWPGDASPLITWPLVVTQAPEGGAYNVGVYRMQYVDKKRAIMRWLKQRGGA